MSGHLGTDRTTSKVFTEFSRPGVQAEARRYCQSCDICQRTTPKGKTIKVPSIQITVEVLWKHLFIYMFCIFGVPSEMLTDIRTQSPSELMAETNRLLSF